MAKKPLKRQKPPSNAAMANNPLNRLRSKQRRKKARAPRAARKIGLWGVLWRIPAYGAFVMGILMLVIALGRFYVPPRTYLMLTEANRLDAPVRRAWTPIEEFSPDLQRAVVASEDSLFCDHTGFDWASITSALAGGGQRGGSSISQQVAKNTYLWPGRNMIRKGLEAYVTSVIELTWPKQRILEVYLNVAETGEGRFGMGLAAREDFGTSPDKLTLRQAAALAMILPNPRGRDAARPTPEQLRRISAIMDGAQTLLREKRDDCFILDG